MITTSTLSHVFIYVSSIIISIYTFVFSPISYENMIESNNNHKTITHTGTEKKHTTKTIPLQQQKTKTSEKIIFYLIEQPETKITKGGIKITTNGTLRKEYIEGPETSSTEFTFELNGESYIYNFSYPNLSTSWKEHTFKLINENPITLQIIEK